MEGTPLRTLFDSSIVGTAQALKTSGGRLAAVEISNPNTVSGFLQIFDLATGDITMGTTAPKLSLAIPKGASATDVGIMDKLWKEGIDFNIAISYAITTTATGSTAMTTAPVGNFFFL